MPRAFQSADENLSFIQFQILFFVQLQNKFSFPRNKSFVHFAFDARKFRASKLLDKTLTGVVTDVVRMIEFYLWFDIANRINHWMRFAEEDHPIDRKKIYIYVFEFLSEKRPLRLSRISRGWFISGLCCASQQIPIYTLTGRNNLLNTHRGKYTGRVCANVWTPKLQWDQHIVTRICSYNIASLIIWRNF